MYLSDLGRWAKKYEIRKSHLYLHLRNRSLRLVDPLGISCGRGREHIDSISNE